MHLKTGWLFFIAASAVAQVSTNQSLNGKYFFRQVMLITDGSSAPNVRNTVSGEGTITSTGTEFRGHRAADFGDLGGGRAHRERDLHREPGRIHDARESFEVGRHVEREVRAGGGGGIVDRGRPNGVRHHL